MIASLTGTLVAMTRESLVIEVGGVGFRVLVPQTLLDALGGRGHEVTLFTHLHVRENDLSLYGFGSAEELALFRLLQTVSGIGPRVALSLLSALSPERLQAALAQEDVALLSRVPGVGLKTARKLAFELRDKVTAELPVEPRARPGEAEADLIAALTTLGYSAAEAREAIQSLPPGPLPLEERVRLTLAYFGS